MSLKSTWVESKVCCQARIGTSADFELGLMVRCTDEVVLAAAECCRCQTMIFKLGAKPLNFRNLVMLVLADYNLTCRFRILELDLAIHCKKVNQVATACRSC